MGQALIEAVLADPELALAAALDVPGQSDGADAMPACAAAARPASWWAPTSTRLCGRPTC